MGHFADLQGASALGDGGLFTNRFQLLGKLVVFTAGVDSDESIHGHGGAAFPQQQLSLRRPRPCSFEESLLQVLNGRQTLHGQHRPTTLFLAKRCLGQRSVGSLYSTLWHEVAAIEIGASTLAHSSAHISSIGACRLPT